MTTISVPIPSHLEDFINEMVKSGRANNKADVVRKALLQMSEDEIVNKILKAQKEPNLKGNLRNLMKRFK